MGALAGGLIRGGATVLYLLTFLCAAIILGIYSYFLAKLSYHDLGISNDWRAVEGLSGAGVLYTLFCVILTFFLGGVAFFAFAGIFLDLLFCGGFVAIAVLTRQADHTCSGYVKTPLGQGLSNNIGPAGTHLSLACHLNQAAFAVSIIGAVLFLVCAIMQFIVYRHHQKEKKYGPSPANDYTSGSGNRKFWKRKPKTTQDAYGSGANAEMGAVGAAPVVNGDGAKDYNGTTAVTNDASANKYQTHGGYHTAPTGTAVNPYGYSNTGTVNSATNY